MAYQRDLAPQVERIVVRALSNQIPAIPEQTPLSGGEDQYSKTVSAPDKFSEVTLGDERIVGSTLELTRPDGYTYLPYVDYDPTPHGFLNRKMPSGELLTAEYVAEEVFAKGHLILDEDTALPQRDILQFRGAWLRAYDDAAGDATVITAEPINAPPETWNAIDLTGSSWDAEAAPYAPPGYYLDRERVYLRGRLTGGTTTTGTVLFSVPADYQPPYTESPVSMTNSGPITLEIDPGGDVSIGDGTAGSGFLSLDGISWRAATAFGPRYPNTSRYPNTDRYPSS